MRIVVGGIAVVLLCAHAAVAQRLPESPIGDPRLDSRGTTSIPVTMNGGTEVLGAEGAASSAPAAGMPLEQPIDPNTYICGPGDVFELNFWGQQNFRLRIAADLEGRVFISKVGFIAVSAKTLTAVRTEVAKKVRANYPGLKFELTLVAPRTFLVHVVNNVKAPGAYTANPLERVSSLLARAGGSSGSRRRITIKRKSGESINADLLKYEITGDTKYNPYVLDGDVIDVPFGTIVASISGPVRRPGTYELIATKDLAELLELAGGFSSSVTRSLPIRIIRRNSDERETFIDLPFKGTAPPNYALSDDDKVIVRSIEELQRSVLLIGAVVGADSIDNATTSKRLNMIEGDTVLSLITRAGGIRAPGDLKRSYISRAKPGGKPEIIPIDLEALLVKRDFSADKPIQMDDTIVVPPMQYSVRVEGAVARAGLYPFNPKFGMAEYIAHAGGRTRSARDLDEAKLIGPDGKTYDYSSSRIPSPGDAILVPERNFTRAEIVQIVIAGAGLVLSGVAIAMATR